ncbi:hypothetical protein BN988_01785 [Oceanobacillus picturae]|uniref:Uncharacterized protein n=1 Tax=Oceanobacillus picturae TaxID=171693 RepID=W9AC24_9BACI|nr:hypothetical protein [Oceanobacillus picturae]CDO03279.1 hypothetical protein BN988_01785 [Oceanobacillus picturae]
MNKRFFILSFVLLLCSFFPLGYVSAAEANEADASKELDIQLSPNDYLFQVPNMKPGDWAPRDLKISNDGKQDFSYHVELANTTEEKRLFNELIIEVADGDEQLYKGNLPNYAIPDRSLDAGEQEELKLTVYFPDHLGNEFQGLETEFVLIFTAEGEEDQQDSISVGGNVSNGDGNGASGVKGGAALPNTSTDIFTLLLFGTILLAVGGGILVIRKLRLIKDHRI